MSPKEKIEIAKESLIFAMLLDTCNAINIVPLINKVDLRLGSLSITSTWDTKQIKSTLNNNIMLSLGALFAVLNKELEDKYGTSKPVINQGTGIEALTAIIGASRNAFAHDPIIPTWHIESSKSSYLKKPWILKISNKCTLNLDLKTLNGKFLNFPDFGGFDNIIILTEYVQNTIF